MLAIPLAVGLAGAAAAEDRPTLLLTGEVFSREAQEIIVPLTTNWQSRISRLVPEGSYVEQGDLVVEFDGTEAANQLEQQREAARTEQARTERDIARLQKELAQARFGLEQAQVTLELATLKADIPKDVIGAIEHAENQLAFEEATKSLENARSAFNDLEKRLQERQNQAQLDARKLELQEAWWAQMLASFEIHAAQDGYVIYGNHPWTRAKFQEGDTVQTSFQVAQVADTDDLAVKVWINGVDKPWIESGARVAVMLDALGGRSFDGLIEQVSDSGSKRQEWGEGDYFEAVVLLQDDVGDALLPGMSALVEVKP
ncbi:MAG: efflux RND transporter periplasmic adaptor subunit [Gammaproteobacteria bacterium]